MERDLQSLLDMLQSAQIIMNYMGLFRKRYADVHDEQFSQAETAQSGENSLLYLVGSILNPEEPYMAGRSQNELTTDLQFQDAIIRRLLIIGEASKRVSTTTQQALTTIPWFAINGLRNRLVHEYDEIDLDIVWDTAVNSLPILISELEKAVPPDSES